jgi:hypothetical protein
VLLAALFNPKKYNTEEILNTLTASDKECLRVLMHNLALTISSQQFQEDYAQIGSQIQNSEIAESVNVNKDPVASTSSAKPVGLIGATSTKSSTNAQRVSHTRTNSGTGFYAYANQVAGATFGSNSNGTINLNDSISLSGISSHANIQSFGTLPSPKAQLFKESENENSASAVERLSPGFTQFGNSNSLPQGIDANDDDEEMGI